MRHLAATLRFDGTDFAGWQVQPNARTVQEVVERAWRKLTGERLRVFSSSRTDSGVHAHGLVVSLTTASTIPTGKLRPAWQRFLPADVGIVGVREVPADFHATFSTLRKTYRYVLLADRAPDPLWRRYSWHHRAELDAAAMHDAAQTLLGRHDFRSFETNYPNKSTSVRTIEQIRVGRFAEFPAGSLAPLPDRDDPAGRFVCLEVTADGFLYNMVRAIVGTLVHVGRGRWTGEDVRRIVAALDRAAAGETAPPEGLFLMSVEYPPDDELPPREGWVRESDLESG